MWNCTQFLIQFKLTEDLLGGQLDVGRKRIGKVAVGLIIRLCILCAAGIGLNLGLSALCSAFNLPLYLDSIGTVIVAFIGGTLPGIVVGLFSNFLNSINDDSAIFYATLNVMIAVSASFFSRHGIRKRDMIPLIFVLAAIGGGLGSILTWFLFGFANEGITAGLAKKVYDAGIHNTFCAQMCADLLTDLVDKTITVAVAFFATVFIPKDKILTMRTFGWQQSPLSQKELLAINKTHVRQISLRSKILILLGTAIAIIAVATVSIGYIIFKKSTVYDHSRFGMGITENLSCYIDADKIDDYLANGESEPGYLETKETLQRMKDSSTDIQFIYVYKIEEDGCHVVFDLDTEDTAASPVGTIIPFEGPFIEMKKELLAGEQIEPIVTDETYGWLLTIYRPLFDSDGNCACYIGVDISMDQLTNGVYRYLAEQISLFLGFFILVLAIGLWLADYNIVYPLNAMAHAASMFAYNSTAERNASVARIKQLDIHTGDEIENLYNAYTHTTYESMHFFNESRRQSRLIDKLQSGLIIVLADMVESRDKCTGDHIKKTASYTNIILRQLKENGLFTDVITEKYIDDVVKSAPLHDIGKIKVPDAILNKPGRLEPSEYEIMKNHTVAGNEIIRKAIANVSESGYLEEAKNLANYHHEKWDGTGYPNGLQGEEIPLSARVMAVADVFDALVSRRSYKEPMTFEQARDFIKNGSGTSFDPRVVDAFCDAEAQIKSVAESFKDF